MNRRTLLKSPFALGAGAVLGIQFAGCSTPAAGPNSPSASTVPTSQPRATPGATSTPGSRVLVAYFSRAGENYYYGETTTLEVGNTEVVAGMISSAANVDVYRIEAADPYPDSYRATVDRNVREQNEDARPAIAAALPAVESYDTVLLGSGIWNVRPPMIMRTFVENVDLSGKRIFPFVTYAVSGLGRTIEDYTRLCPRSRIGEGLAVRGEQVRDARAEVEAWLRRIGLISA
jgi:flavodoxin